MAGNTYPVGLLVSGVAVQLSSVVLLALLPLYAAAGLGLPAAELARRLVLPRYAATAAGVLFASPLAAVYGEAWLLRRAMVLTALSLLALAVFGQAALTFSSALASATSAVAMVAMNALLQSCAHGNMELRAKLNSHYRLLSALASTTYPAFAAHVLLHLLPYHQGYGAAFGISAGLLLLCSWRLDTAYDRLLPPRTDAGEQQQEQEQTSGDRLAPRSITWQQLWPMMTAPYRQALKHPEVLVTVLHITLMSLPPHILGALNTSLLLELGASEAYQATLTSISSLFAVVAIFYSQAIVQRLTARTTYVTLSLANGLCLLVLGQSKQLPMATAAFLISTVVNKAMPVAMSMWIADAAPGALLTTTISCEKIANSAARALWSEGLARLAERKSINQLFAGSGVIMLTLVAAEAALDPNIRRIAGLSSHARSRSATSASNGHSQVVENGATPTANGHSTRKKRQ